MRNFAEHGVHTDMRLQNACSVNPDAGSARQRIAVFDLDRTITRTGTYSPFLVYAARHLNPIRLVMIPAVVLAMAGYKLGLLPRTRLKEIMQHLLLGKAVEKARIKAIAESFAIQTLARNTYVQALEQIAVERQAGAQIVIASAAHHFYLGAIGEGLKADSVIGTQSIWANGYLSPRIAGENCYGLEKLRRLTSFLQLHQYERERIHICFYSDDLSDLPIFEFADEAIATNPSRRLLSRASKLKWRIIDWRR